MTSISLKTSLLKLRSNQQNTQISVIFSDTSLNKKSWKKYTDVAQLL